MASPALFAARRIVASAPAPKVVTATTAFFTTGAGAQTQSYKLPSLPYDYKDLEPVISAEIMELHHSKHHNAYVTNLNAALDKYSSAQNRGDIAEQIALQSAIRFNGGGHINHSIFWTNLAPKKAGGGTPPTGPLADAINKGTCSLSSSICPFHSLPRTHLHFSFFSQSLVPWTSSSISSTLKLLPYKVLVGVGWFTTLPQVVFRSPLEPTKILFLSNQTSFHFLASTFGSMRKSPTQELLTPSPLTSLPLVPHLPPLLPHSHFLSP
jgi:hypothetical protein